MTNYLPVANKELQIRELEYSDSASIAAVACRREISDTMISIPHPYSEDAADRYVMQIKDEIESGSTIAFVIEKIKESKFCGLVEVRKIDHEHSLGELSFWLAPDAWGKGYMSEVVHSVVGYSFTEMNLNRLYAYHMQRNPASGRVLAKNGFIQEGLLRQRVRKWGKFEDVLLWAILFQDWRKSVTAQSVMKDTLKQSPDGHL